MIVHHIVRQQHLIVAAPAKVQSRRIIQRTRRADTREEPVVFPVPETVRFGWRFDGRGFCGFRGGRRLALVLGEHRRRTMQRRQSHQNSHPETAHSKALLGHLSACRNSASSITVRAAPTGRYDTFCRAPLTTAPQELVEMKKTSLPLSKVYGLLEPGPVVLVTSARGGRANVMTMSWHMMVDFEPPTVACVISNRNFTFDILRETRECVINIPTVELAKTVVAC